MSPGAKQIYAAVFAAGYRQAIQSPPSSVIHNGALWSAWEIERITSLAEAASGAARAFDDPALDAALLEGFSKDSDVYRDFAEMRGAGE